MKTYNDFLKDKAISTPMAGLLEIPELNENLFDFQKDIVTWALRRGRAAIFADCGMGKTLMQLEWARHVPGRVLILAPLAVANQTMAEGKKFGIEVSYARDQESVQGKITITNYEILSHFDPSVFDAVVLDESSILKSYDGKTRTQIIESFLNTPYRLACTATPAPNDYMELGNHSEFLGNMTRSEMLSMFFVHDGGETQKWRLKGHAESDYWKWICSWAVMIRKPSDLGYEDGKFLLPALNFHEHIVKATSNGDYLLPMPASSLQERLAARRDSISERVEKCAEMVNASNEPWIVWCNLNSESGALKKAIGGSVEVKGSDSLISKQVSLTRFSNGVDRVMISKPSIAGHGMNWQHCRNIAFVGLSDSYEEFYQAIRRCWRFGQTKEVNCHLIISDMEGAVMANIKRKEKESLKMADNMVEQMGDITKSELKNTTTNKNNYETGVAKSENFELHWGDCVEVSKKNTQRFNSLFDFLAALRESLYVYGQRERHGKLERSRGIF